MVGRNIYEFVGLGILSYDVGGFRSIQGSLKRGVEWLPQFCTLKYKRSGYSSGLGSKSEFLAHLKYGLLH